MSRLKINSDAPFQSIRGAARLTGLSTTFLRAGCKGGTVPHIRVGSDYRICMPQLLAQLEAASAANMKGGAQ